VVGDGKLGRQGGVSGETRRLWVQSAGVETRLDAVDRRRQGVAGVMPNVICPRVYVAAFARPVGTNRVD
jgi:hypothetical protein